MSPEAARAPVVLPPEEPNLPKIRVVVRKRPLNRKVHRLWACHRYAKHPACHLLTWPLRCHKSQWLLMNAEHPACHSLTWPLRIHKSRNLLMNARHPTCQVMTWPSRMHQPGCLLMHAKVPACKVMTWPLRSHQTGCLLQEEDRGEEDSIEAVMAEARLTVHEPRVKVDLTKYVEHHAFSFDDVLDEGVSNDAVYRSTVQPLVATIFRAGKVSMRKTTALGKHQVCIHTSPGEGLGK